MEVTRLVPEWIEDAGVKQCFLEALRTSGGARARHLAQILSAHWQLRVWIWKLGLDDFYLIIVSAKEDELARALGEAHNFPRGYPIIWQPGQRLHLFGFYPKFKNDERYRTLSMHGVDRLSLSVKWSGFLFAILAFCHRGRYFWLVTSKNSGNCQGSEIEDFTQIAADVITAELGDNLSSTIRHLADTHTYLCGECMSLLDQGHGYGYTKDAVIVTCAGEYDNQYEETARNDALLMHLPPEGMRSLAERCGLRYVRQVEVPSRKVDAVYSELERSRDRLTINSVMRLMARHGLPVDQFREHKELIASDTMEGLIMQLHYADGQSVRVKWKLPRYTMVTMMVRQVRKRGIDGGNLCDLATTTAKSWCRSEEGKEYYAMFGLVAGTLVKELPSGELVAPWITAANQVFAMDDSEVLRRGREIMHEARKSDLGSIADARYVRDVQKHDGMGCALVTFANAEDCQRLLAAYSKIDLSECVRADIKQHYDKATRLTDPIRAFLAWGRRQELQDPIEVKRIVLVLEALLSGKEDELQGLIHAEASTQQRSQVVNMPIPPDHRQLRLVFSGLMGSGKSTLCRMLTQALGASCISQDEYTHRGKNARNKAFLEELRRAMNDPGISALLLDRVNSLRRQRNEISAVLRDSVANGETILVELCHPDDMQPHTYCENALDLCESRILGRGENHPSLIGTRHNLKAILICTSRHLEPVEDDEAETYHAHIRVDMTMTPEFGAAHVLSELERFGILKRYDGASNAREMWLIERPTAPPIPVKVARTRKGIFEFDLPREADLESSKSIRLNVCSHLGAGIDLTPTWYGMVVGDIEDAPGQPDLRRGDCIVRVRDPGVSDWAEGYDLREREDADLVFGEHFRDGAMLLVEPHCETRGLLPCRIDLDWHAFQADLDHFSEDYAVELSLHDRSVIVLQGPQSAVVLAYEPASSLIASHIAEAISE